MLIKSVVFTQVLSKCRKSKVLIGILILFTVFQLFATQITSSGKLSVINTEYFDIIYHEKSEVTARIIASRADDLYRKAAQLLNTPMTLHIPVVITPDTEQLNAFYTSFPYNKIVLFDTVPDSSALSVFPETIVSIFYHELVHAVSLNIRSPFWNFMSKVFGDPVSISSMISMPTSFKEGATVSFESLDGAGRMNDGKSLHYVVQSKIEDRFPSWQDVAGGRDVFPIGPYPYNFGGAFNIYLQQKYGMEKFAELWREAGKLSITQSAFYKTYRKDIRKTWLEFQDSIVIPPLASEESVIPLINNHGDYVSLAVCNEGIAYISSSECAVMFQKNNEQKPYKLCDADYGTTRICFSNNGLYLVVTGLIPSTESIYGARIFDVKNKRFVGQKLLHLRDACFITLDDGKDYIVGTHTESQFSTMELYSLEEILNTEKSQDTLIPCYSYSFDLNEEIYSPVSCSNGVAFLSKNYGKWFLSMLLLQQNEVVRKDFPFPEDTIPSDLTSYRLADDKYRLIFNTTVKPDFSDGVLNINRLPFLSFIDYDNSSRHIEINSQKLDVSGGVYSPVYSDGKWVFISRMADCYKINYFTDIPGGVQKLEEIGLSNNTSSTSPKSEPLPEYASSNYNPAKYMLKGFLIPIGNYPLLEGQSVTPLASTNMYGFTYFTSDPVEKVNIALGGGINPYENLISASLALSTSYKGLTCTLNGSGVWTYSAFKEGYASLFTSYKKPIGTLSDSINFINRIEWLYDDINNNTFADTAQISYSHYRQQGMSIYAYNGFEPVLIFSGIMTPWSKTSNWYSVNTGVGMNVRFARLLPFTNPKNFTVNLPLKLSASLIPSSSVFLLTDAKVVLFSAEIQKAFRWLPIYTRRFTLTSGYTADWQDDLPNMCILQLPTMFSSMDSMKLKHGITAGANFEVVPVIGNFISLNFKLGVDFTWYYLNEQDNKPFSMTLCGQFVF